MTFKVQQDIEEALLMRERGTSWELICQAMNVSPSTMHRRILRKGIHDLALARLSTDHSKTTCPQCGMPKMKKSKICETCYKEVRAQHRISS